MKKCYSVLEINRIIKEYGAEISPGESKSVDCVRCDGEMLVRKELETEDIIAECPTCGYNMWHVADVSRAMEMVKKKM